MKEILSSAHILTRALPAFYCSRLSKSPLRTSPSPPVLPDLLADQTADARLLGCSGGGDDRAFRSAAGDLEQQLGTDRFLEFFAVLDRHHEGAGAADDAILVVEIEVVDIHRRVGRLLDHDRQ